jgi:curli biogenesis system outer membrane secretion channel CsgG
MKKSLMIILGFIIFITISASQILTANDEKKLLVAVVDFKNQTGDTENDSLAKGLAGSFINELQKTKKFRIIERERLESLLTELKLNMSGMVDAENAKQIGKQLGVDALIFGNLSAIKYSQNKQTILIMYTEGQKTEVSLDARIVKVETGEVLATAEIISPVKNRRWIAFWFAKIGKITDKNSNIREGIEKSCKKLALNLAKQL